jgi:hypothetical protein
MAIKKNAPNYLKISKQPFTTLINKTIDLIPDPAAIGIYVYLASKQTDWVIQEKDLMNRFGVGRDYIRSRMKVLKEVGLLIKQAVRNDKGQILHWETILLNQITENTSPGNNDYITENPPSGKPRHLDNPTHIKKRSREINNSNISKGISDETLHDDEKNNGIIFGENHETSNLSDTSLTQDENTEEFENHNNQAVDTLEAKKGLDGSSTYTKSDYRINRTLKCTVPPKIKQYNIENILASNIFQIPEQIIEDWMITRKKKRAPVTQTAWNKINKELAKCKEQGVDPIEAFEKMVAHGWQALDADWFCKEKKGGGAGGSHWDVDSVMRA